MPVLACEALRQIELGNLALTDFTPPKVFESDRFRHYRVTVADLRRHLVTCRSCGADMEEAKRQLNDLDNRWTSRLSEKLRTVLNGLDEAVEIFPHEPLGTGWEVDWETELDFLHMKAVKGYAELGGNLSRIFEVLFVPAEAFQDNGIMLAKQSLTRGEAPAPGAALPEEGLRILSQLGPDTLREALRAILLAESFQWYFAREPIKERVEWLPGQPELEVETTDGIGWMRIWAHYSSLADVEARRMYRDASKYGSPEGSEVTQRLNTALNMLEAIGRGTESLLSGQTAMMAVLEHALRELQTKFEEAPSHVKDSCEGTVRCALAPLWEGLDARSRRWLVTAEYGYSQFPPDLDFSGAILLFTKAFELELKRAIKPIQGEFEKFLRSDVGLPQKPVIRYTLGDFLNVLRAGERTLDPLLQTCGLAYDAIYTAVEKVNTEAPAKHLAPRGKADATTFRALFLGSPTVFTALFPPVQR